MARHLDRAQLDKLARGRLSRAQRRAIVRHLLEGCETCLSLTTRLLRPRLDDPRETPPVADSTDGDGRDYSRIFDRVRHEVSRRQQTLLVEQAQAPELFAELQQHPFDRQRVLVVNSPRFQTWALCEQLLEAARDAGFREPARALDLARLGLLVTEHLATGDYGAARCKDLAARCWAVLGNAERIRSDFRAAEKSLQQAERLLREGTGDPLEKAGVLLLKASLLGNQQRFFEAFRVLDRVLAAGRKYGDIHLCGKAMITRGFLCGVAQEPAEEANRWLAEGLELIDPAAEPRLVVAARHNLVLHLAESGRTREALDLLERTRPLYILLGDRMNLLRLRWIEGKLSIAQGRLAQAEPLLRQVRKELAEQEIGYDAALVCLDLARIYARQGKSAEMRRLAEEMLPIFESRQIHREALSALIIFHKAAELESVTLGLVQELSEFLDRTRSQPDLRFRESD